MSETALITGGTRGIGLGIAIALAKEGIDLAINGVRDDSEVEPTIRELSAYGVKVAYFRGDISEKKVRSSMVSSVCERFGKINFLVNNAGIPPPERRDILEATEENFDRVISVNLRGPYFLTQLVANRMIQFKKAWPGDPFCVINISSVSASVASVNRGEYCISKAGVSMATRLWASRLGEFGINVYEIQPGIIDTDMTIAAKEKYDRLISQGLTIQPRWGTPEDVGKIAAALVRGSMPYSTGQVIMADGGMSLPRL